MKITYKRFRSELKMLRSSAAAPVYMFYGAEDLLKNEAVSAMEKIVADPASRDFNCGVFYVPDSDIETIMATAEAMPFMAEKRFVVVKRINKLPAAQDAALAKYIERPFASTCLVLVGEEKLPKRALFTAIEAKYPTVNFYRLYENEIPAWIRETVRARGMDITGDAAMLLLELAGDNLYDVSQEIEKLALYASGEKTLAVSHVRSCCGSHRENTAFDLLPALARRDTGRSLGLLESMLAGGTDEFAVLAAVSDFFRKVNRFTEAMKCGSTEQDALSAAGVRYYSDEFLENARLLRSADIKKILPLILETEIRIKSGNNSRIEMERLLLELCKF
jgi:DNA polymerase-3 subunit delta